MSTDAIVVRGAREHNLKNIDVAIPRSKLVVITGVSGSGKSSLAFDTIYAEGQRRYVESLSAYARQFLGQMEKPDVDTIEGLSPAIAIDQKGVSHNPRSTVGTVTEIYDHLRLLFARVGRPHCPQCGRPIQQQTVQQMVDAVLDFPEGTRFMVLAPVVHDRRGEHASVLDDLRKAGFVRARVDGQLHDLGEQITLDRYRQHTIEAVVDRLAVEPGDRPALATRVADSLETALKLGSGIVQVLLADDTELLFSEHFACPHCGISVGAIEPRTFSFNNPHGACPTCTGLGQRLEVDPELVVPNRELPLAQGAIKPWARSGATGLGHVNEWYLRELAGLSREQAFSLQTPFQDLTQEQQQAVLFGPDGHMAEERRSEGRRWHGEARRSFEGVLPNLERRYRETESDYVRQEIERYMSARPCPTCQGRRLKPEALAVTVDGCNIHDVSLFSVRQAHGWVDRLEGLRAESPLTERERTIGYQIFKELRSRLGFLLDVGLDYLNLGRSAGSLSGGEAHRIRLATQIGSGLTGVLYVCDEPSVGLHPVDNARLIGTLERLRDLGNTVLVVEHDEAMMRAADWIIDMGPGAGEQGGYVVANGPIETIMQTPDSITGQYLSGVRSIPMPTRRRPGNGLAITVRGARQHNLRDLTVQIPLGLLVCITGVSGSGKSTLVNDILYRKAAQVLHRAREKPGECDAIDGLEHIDKVIQIDQSPIGRTPRSNPATYIGAFTPIREIFAALPEARLRGYLPGRFSFNVKGGRCEACRGDGYVQIEMQFLPDVTVPCEVCRGKRYNREALEILFKGKSIADVLSMTAAEALAFFDAFPAIRNKLGTLCAVGLGYIRLGQPATTLSGGEAQRVKLASELSRRATGRTLYILDEPTTGLSFSDVAALLDVMQRLVDQGNTVVLIEHHLDLIKGADYIIDLGPEGGERGGEVIATGTPEEVAQVANSHTGQFLRQIFRKHLTTAPAIA